MVLVHGAFADGSGWEAVAKILEKDGYTVSVAQPPETSYAEDVKYASAEELDEAESKLDIEALVTQGIRGTTVETFRYAGGQVTADEPQPVARPDKQRSAIA